MKKRNSTPNYLDPSRFWNNRDPTKSEYVWEDNASRAQRLAELEYWEKNPAKANLETVLRLFGEFISKQEEERKSFRSEWTKLVRSFHEAVQTIDQQSKQISFLNNVIADLNLQIESAYNQQKQIQERLIKIEDEQISNRKLAVQYQNEAVSAFNLIVNDVVYRRFAGDEIAALEYELERMGKNKLEEGAIQGLAVDILSRVYAIHKKVARKKTEYDLTYAIAKAKASNVRAQFINWRDEMYFDADKKNHVDMGFWTRGVFPELMDNVEIISHNLEIAHKNPDIKVDDLKRMILDLDQLEKNGEETVKTAFSVSSQSEKAEALARRTAIILADDFFFRTVYLGFNDDDERSAYVLQLENHASGIRMQFIFTPLNSTQIGCDYSVSFSGYQDEYRVRDIIESLISELSFNSIHTNHHEIKNNIIDRISFIPLGQVIHLSEQVKN